MPAEYEGYWAFVGLLQGIFWLVVFTLIWAAYRFYKLDNKPLKERFERYYLYKALAIASIVIWFWYMYLKMNGEVASNALTDAHTTMFFLASIVFFVLSWLRGKKIRKGEEDNVGD